jgi:Flavin reductase like domain
MQGNELGKMIASTIVQGQHAESLSSVKEQLESNVTPRNDSSILLLPLKADGSEDVQSVPLITGPGVLAHMECRVSQSTEVGDHTVVFAEVLNLDEVDTTSAIEMQPGQGNKKDVALLYYNGKFASVADP